MLRRDLEDARLVMRADEAPPVARLRERIGEEATLKHFHQQGDTVMLLADNAAVCPPMVYTGPQLNEIRIEGRAVGFCRGL